MNTQYWNHPPGGWRVIDLGAGSNPDSRATETADRLPGCDHQFDLDDPWPFAEASVDELLARHSLEHVTDIEHVFAEAGRVLRDGGWLTVTMPVGKNALADDDHERVWQWTTPTHYCRDRQRPWDPETAFVLQNRTPDVSLQGFLAPLNPLFQIVVRASPGEAVYRASAGELTATYRRVERNA